MIELDPTHTEVFQVMMGFKLQKPLSDLCQFLQKLPKGTTIKSKWNDKKQALRINIEIEFLKNEN